MDALSKRHCVPCEGGVAPFDQEKINVFMSGLSLVWEVVEGKKLKRQFKFKNFIEAMKFAGSIVPVAEGEGHHPDLHIYYNKVTVELWTHAIGGLSENDFIMAAKIELLA